MPASGYRRVRIAGTTIACAAAWGAAWGATESARSALAPPDGNVPYLSAAAVGTQDYVCLPRADAPGQGAWTFLAPQATLSMNRTGDARRGPDVAEHFLGRAPGAAASPGPAWRSPVDQSTVWGAKAASVAAGSGPDCPNGGAIACLLVKAVANAPGERPDGLFARTSFIQRTETRGGSAPSTPCTPGQLSLVAYTATYVFYRSR